MEIITLDQKHMKGSRPTLHLPEGIWIAGGAVRSWFDGSEFSRDVDVFATGENPVKEFIKRNRLDSLSPSRDTEQLTEYKRGQQIIQIIRFYRTSLEDVFDHFDFTLCQFGMDNEKAYCTPEALISLSRKHLAVHKIQEGFEFDTMRRSYKYMAKGYKPCLGTMRDIANSFISKTQEQLDTQVSISPGGGSRLHVRWD
jgi:hypothetical protein